MDCVKLVITQEPQLVGLDIDRLLVGYFPSCLACIAWSLCEDDTRATFIVQQQEVDIAFVVFSKSLPRALRSDALMLAPDSRSILAGLPSSAKKRQQACSSSLLFLIRAVASFTEICRDCS